MAISFDSIIFNLQIFCAGWSPSPTSRKRRAGALEVWDAGLVLGRPVDSWARRVRTVREGSVVPERRGWGREEAPGFSGDCCVATG
jgi:hypothetical protein